MYLHRLDLHGFKSFADKTTVQFSPGVTAIVGPNGCGKSNIIDAVRWVLGEQRSRILRADKMENVIFNGAKGRRPLGMAEVSMTVENTRHVLPTEYSEITVTRRLYRSGESEYLLNKRPCRLKDIHDLFMDTGLGAGAYSVIELKMVEDILSENTHDRRRLIEEAAGITKYKLRRAQALRKLDSTRADLARIRDLVDEVGRQVRSLERQARRARRHRVLSDELRNLVLQATFIEFDRLTREKSQLEKESRSLGDKITELTTRQAGEDARMESQRAALVEREQTLAETQRKLNSHVDRIRRVETEIRLDNERIDSARRALTRAEREEEESKGRRERINADLVEALDRLQKITPELEEAVRTRDQARDRRDGAQAQADRIRQQLDNLRGRERELTAQKQQQQGESDRLHNRTELQAEEKDRLQGQLNELERYLDSVSERLRKATAERARNRQNIERQEEGLKQAEENLLSLQAELDKAVDAERTSERRKDALEAELDVLNAFVLAHDDAEEAVRFLVHETSWTADAPQTVADVLSCDREYATAVESALGAFGEYFVVETDDEVEVALERLRDHKKGSAGFIVLDRLKHVRSSNGTDGNTAPGLLSAASVVQADSPSLQRVADVLLRDCFIVEDLEEARKMAAGALSLNPFHRFVAKTGEWADASGRVAGGSTNGIAAVAHRLSQRERRSELESEIQVLEQELEANAADIERIRAEIAGINVAAVRMRVREAEHELAQAEQEYNQVVFEETSTRTRHTRVSEQIEAKDTALRADNDAIRKLSKSRDQADADLQACITERERTESSFQDVELESRVALAEFGEANVRAVTVQNDHDNLKRDTDRLQGDLSGLDAADEARTKEVAALEEDIRAAEARLETNRELLTRAVEERAELDESVKQAEQAVVELKSSISDLDTVLREVRRMREVTLRDESTRTTRLAEINTRLSDLRERTEMDYQISPEGIEIEPDPEFDRNTAQDEILHLRTKLRNLGSINELALDEYEEQKERLDFMTAQQSDLESAEETLLDTIDEINATASARFEDTYASIQENFGRLFEELFGEGAAASLQLTDPSDPLESPVEIIARPRGKKNVTIAQLSGGEKALTATALLFAIYLVKASPFCILDEVDAPLDDANIGRFMQLLRQFSDTTQFVLVTHNKLTMEAADRMYGVTMEKEGVSKIVSVSFEGDTAEGAPLLIGE